MAGEDGSSMSIQGLIDREGCLDAVNRLVMGATYKDRELLASAYTEDIEESLSGSGDVSNKGREAVVGRVVAGPHFRLDSAYSTTNQRVTIKPDGKTASMQYFGENIFFPKGQSADPAVATEQYYKIAGRYQLELRKESDRIWRISRFTGVTAYAQGDPKVMEASKER